MGTYAEVEVAPLDRRLTEDELRNIAELFYEIGRKQGALEHPLAPLTSVEAVYRTLKVANDNGYLEAFALSGRVIGILMYDIGNPWWSECFCLKEMLVLTVDPEFKGFGRIALERLQELAEEHGCALIESGSAFCLESKIIHNLYTKKGGFQFTYPNFVRVNEQ